ncbi:hypothetical protein XACLG97_10940005 [Xanthomonas citri pv. citri]|nr:hypothetical protein XACLG97_10940005 [Xanthomonas citri pv. citri]
MIRPVHIRHPSANNRRAIGGDANLVTANITIHQPTRGGGHTSLSGSVCLRILFQEIQHDHIQRKVLFRPAHHWPRLSVVRCSEGLCVRCDGVDGSP